MTKCEECGAEQSEGASCRECFDALLAYENERPEVFFAVHHITVATYFLQHPTGYARATLDTWLGLVNEALDTNLPPRAFLARMGREFNGARKTREAGATVPDDWPRAWPLTVRDAFDPNAELPAPDDYIRAARAWANSVRIELATR